MASEVEICNVALTMIGADRINALTEGSKNANICALMYPVARAELLPWHPWNFAIRRVELAPLSSAPEFGLAYKYQAPTDMVRVVSAHAGANDPWETHFRREGTALLSDAPALFLRYVADIVDPNLMSAPFRAALAARLSIPLASSIAQSNTMVEAMQLHFREVIRKATSLDAMDDWPDEAPASSWVSAR